MRSGKRNIDPFLRALRRLAVAGLVLACAAGVFHLFGRWLDTSDTFRVRRIEVSGNDFLTDEAVIALAGLDPEATVWEATLTELEQNIGTHPLLSSVRVSVYPPAELRINVEEKQPLALLNVEGALYCVDEDGMVLPSKPGKLYDLPVLSGSFKGGVRVGSQARSGMIDEGLDFLRTVLRDRSEMYTRISEVVLGDSEGLILYTQERGLPVRLGEGDYGRKIRYLEAVLDDLRGEDTRGIDYIDVRYRGQVFIGMRA